MRVTAHLGPFCPLSDDAQWGARANEEKTIILTVKTVYFEGFGIVPNYYTETGKLVMTAAAHGVKRLHLELGGKAPFVVFDDADLDAAIRGAVAAAYINCGQDCTAATRAAKSS
jgi:hypothetical protein